MKYEVFIKSGDQDVRVFQSDIECVVRVLVDGIEVYALTGTPTFQGNQEQGFTRELVGGTTEATAVDAKGKSVTLLDEEWVP